MNEHSQTDEQQNIPRRIHSTAIPLGSSFNDLFAGGASVWLKIAGGAIATPVAVALIALRSKRRGGMELPESPVVIAAVLGSCAIVGAVLGGLLSMKDVVQNRLADGKPVAFPLKLLFGFGMWSLLLIWFPGAIMLTLVVTILTLTV